MLDETCGAKKFVFTLRSMRTHPPFSGQVQTWTNVKCRHYTGVVNNLLIQKLKILIHLNILACISAAILDDCAAQPGASEALKCAESSAIWDYNRRCTGATSLFLRLSSLDI